MANGGGVRYNEPMIDRRALRTWHTSGLVTMRDAIDGVLAQLEAMYESDAPVPLPVDPLPLSTGIEAVDRMLGGGIRRGQLTLFEAGERGPGEILMSALARHISHPTLYAVRDTGDATEWLLAGASAVPRQAVHRGMLDEDDWAALSGAIKVLSERLLALSETTSVAGLAAQMKIAAPGVVLVQAAERFGHGAAVVAQLAELAATSEAAIVASIPPLGEHDDWFGARVQRVQVVAHDDALRVTLARTDDLDMVSVASIDIEPLTSNLLTS
jgi:hypothetical protein